MMVAAPEKHPTKSASHLPLCLNGFQGHMNRAAWRFAAAAILLALQWPAAMAVQTVTRQTEYSYDPTTGLLNLERVDPGGSHCVETSYTHDVFGNRKMVEVRPCSSTTASFAPRVTVNDFAAGSDPQNSYPAGAYQTATRSVVSTAPSAAVLAEARASYAPSFGAASSQTEVALVDPTKSVTKRTLFDGFGRVWREYVPVDRRASDNSVAETYVEHTYGNYCLGAKAPLVVPSTCLNFSVTVPVDYASKRLVDGTGAVVSAATGATVSFITAYFIESTSYGSDGSVIGAKSRVHFDALHRQIAKETQSYDQTWVRTLSGFDALGQNAATWAAHFVPAISPPNQPYIPPSELRQWTAARDNLHRPLEQKQYWRGTVGAAAQELRALVTYKGLETTATVPSDSTPAGVTPSTRTVTTFKNGAGQTAQTVNADGATINMAFDPVGNLVKTVDALGYATTIQYTSGTARFKTSMVDLDQGIWSYTYDALGQLKSQTDARGKVVGMEYDVLGRMVSKTTLGLNSSWTYTQTETGTYCAYGLSRPCGSKTGNTSTPTTTAIGYDPLGRATSTVTTLDRAYTSQATFDTLGRVSSTTYPTGLRVNYVYSLAGPAKLPGVLERVEDNANAARVFWRIDTQAADQVFDAQGHLRKAQLGNGVVTDHQFDPISGKAFNLRGGTSVSPNVFDQRYNYDKANNLSTRTEGLTGVIEAFTYDVLDRLTRYDLQSASDIGANHVVALTYNAFGNIIEKSDVGGYTYDPAAKPHAVRNAGGTNYTYDANGNISGSTGSQSRTQSWTDFNLPDTLSYQGKSVAFIYDASYQRVKEVTTDGATVRALYLIHPNNAGGLGYEREETRVGGNLTRNENRHFISVGGVVVAVVKTLNIGDPNGGPFNGVVSTDPKLTLYWHKDALGSIVAVSDAAAAIERMAFDAWGRRQRDTGRVDPFLNPAHGDRGYTGHEHLDELGLIHMNGRVFDPVLARFLSPDPMLQSPNDLQNYNRYSYVLNNPLRYADPTGQSIELIALLAVTSVALIEMGNENWRMVGAILLGAALGPGGLVESGLGAALGADGFIALAAQTSITTLSSIIAGGITGLVVSGGDPIAAGISAMTAGAFSVVGLNPSLGNTQRVIAHALVGCISQAASGGKCGPGALATGFGKLATINLPPDPSFGSFIAVTVVGGTASAIGGGKFSNGAMGAAFGYLFNAMTMRQVAAMTTKGLALLSQEVAQYGFELIAPEVSFRGASGVNIRIDGVYMGSDGRILFGEAKVGDFADLTRNQKIGLPELQDGKGTFYGEHARAIAARLNVQPDASGRFTLGTTQIHGVYIGTYERSTPQTGRMQNINQMIQGRGFWPRSGDN